MRRVATLLAILTGFSLANAACALSNDVSDSIRSESAVEDSAADGEAGQDEAEGRSVGADQSKTAQVALDTAAIDSYIESHMAEHQIPGLALSVVHNDEAVYAQGYGVAGPDGTPVSAQTPFVIGSGSKSFTALAVMQLVEAGNIDLDAPVQTYLPWFTMADPEAAKQITVRHLLTQTSGISALSDDKGMISDDMRDEALETGVRGLADHSLNRPVGESFEYANYNYATLGLIVQTVSGQSYESYIEDHIFAPLEMSNSYTIKSEAEAGGLAVGHTSYFGSPRAYADAPHPRLMLPAGFLISSAEDMGHHLIAQLNEGRFGEVRVLAPELVAMMHEPAIETDGAHYAFGWRTGLVEGEPTVRHGGDTASFHTDMAFSPTSRWGVAVLINYSGAPVFHVLNEPANEVLRVASGYDTGHATEDMTVLLKVIWGIIILIAGLNLVLWSVFYWRRWRRERSLRLVWQVLLPLALDIVLLWLILSFVPNLLDFSLPSLVAYAPDLGLILQVCGVVVGLTAVLRIAVYFAFSRRTVSLAAASGQKL